MEDGIATVCFGTGMAAISATTLTLLRQGDHVVSSAFLFGNTNSFFGTLATFGINTTFVDATDVANVAAALEPNTRAVFVETIANPATQVVDLAGIGERLEILPDRILVYTSNGEKELEKIVKKGLKPVTSLVRRSSLEDVFLRLTGRSLVE